jgi:Lon protease-like protein
MRFAWMFFLLAAPCRSFLPTCSYRSRHKSRLFGIPEWRDLMFDFPGTSDDRRLGREQGGPPKSVCILPFPYEQVLLQGETKQLRLYEDRFIRLFDDVMQNHEGVVAMGLLAKSGIIQTVPLCEVEAYNRMDGFGIFVTIRVVGRAHILDVVQQAPYMKAVCTELTDWFPPNLEMPNLLADTIEDVMLTLSALEHKLDQLADDSGTGMDEEMERRINVAKLDDKFFADDLDDEEDDQVFDRRRRFQQAYRVAMESDTQGYVSASSRVDAVSSRTQKELTAVSWAAYMTDIIPEEDATYRIQAMDHTDVFERLKLASFMLREKRDQLQKQLDIANVNKKKKDDDDVDL